MIRPNSTMYWGFAIATLAFLAPGSVLSASNYDSLVTALRGNSSADTTFSPIPCTLETGTFHPESGQEIIIIEFKTIVESAFAPLEYILQSYSPAGPPPILFAIPDGPQTIDKPANYSTVCSNATTLFESPMVFWNCLNLGITNVLLEHDVITLDKDSVESTDNDLHFGDIHTFNGSGVLDDIATCIRYTCQNMSDRTCDPTVQGNLTDALDPNNNITETLHKVYLGFTNYCNGAGVKPNSDVVGPGVVISYISQAAVIATFFFASKTHHAIRRYSAWRHRKSSVTDSRLTSDPRRSRVRWVVTRCFVALQAVMADFQEAQAVFVSTVQIASIWFFSAKKLSQNSSSYAEANATNQLAILIPAFGLIPVLLGQAILYRSGKHWWYTTILTSVTAFLTWYSASRANQADYYALWLKLKEDSPAPHCGGNPSPMTYCGVYNPNSIYNEASVLPTTAAEVGEDLSFISESPMLFNLYLGIIVAAPPFLLATQLYFWIPKLRYWSRISEYLKRASRWSRLQDRTKRILLRIVRFILFIIWFVFQLALLISLVFIFSDLLYIFGFQTQLAGGWSYGQLIAALIWVPIGLRFVYYIIFGIEKGVESRLGHKFDVQAKDEEGQLASDSPPREVRYVPEKSQYISILDVNDDVQIPRVSWRGIGPERSNFTF
ncbi:hypothetical protein O1611_g8368 [Lasiodiplodia mahajangana]|uniref:Uncharacterized protein n=1 Tax=Lasiodiplodia mahajangana TaxID=1108764 RepID=A0ACC2JCM6_9PEZI|nr:hypothetical protein O1611_g8368 [Lasiodiplodia mahajangana]